MTRKVDMSKKELLELVSDMEQKIKELSHVEKRTSADLAALPHPAIGLTRDKDGYYHMVRIKYNPETMAAMIESIDKIESRDLAIVMWKMKQEGLEKIMRKARGGKYDE